MSFAGDLDSRSAIAAAQHLDSRSAIDMALHRCDTSFPASLFRSRTSGQVLYLEAGKDLVDTLLSFLLLPLGTVVHMTCTGVPQEKHYGAISSIFKSVEKLDSELLHVDRNCILAPRRLAANNPSGLSKASTSTGVLHLCQDADAKRPSCPRKKKLPALIKSLYECYQCKSLSSERETRCYTCWPENGRYISNCKIREDSYHFPAEDVQRQNDLVAEQEPVEEYDRAIRPGFVKENITFMVTDKLEIIPCTTVEIMSVLKQMKVNSLADLQSNKITVTKSQVLQLLGSAMTSKSCLNEVFGTGETSRIPGETSPSEMHDATAKEWELLIPCD